MFHVNHSNPPPNAPGQAGRIDPTGTPSKLTETIIDCNV